MKRNLLLLMAGFMTASAWAQGSVNFSTVGMDPILQAPEKGGGIVPADATFQAVLFYAPLGVTDEASFMQAGGPGGFISGGRIFAGERFLPSYTEYFNFFVRVWEVADPDHVGMSAIFQVRPTPSHIQGPVAKITPPLQTFQLRIVPEPSVMALGALGAISLWFRRGFRQGRSSE